MLPSYHTNVLVLPIVFIDLDIGGWLQLHFFLEQFRQPIKLTYPKKNNYIDKMIVLPGVKKRHGNETLLNSHR